MSVVVALPISTPSAFDTCTPSGVVVPDADTVMTSPGATGRPLATGRVALLNCEPDGTDDIPARKIADVAGTVTEDVPDAAYALFTTANADNPAMLRNPAITTERVDFHPDTK
jgi:hypothetical protein